MEIFNQSGFLIRISKRAYFKQHEYDEHTF